MGSRPQGAPLVKLLAHAAHRRHAKTTKLRDLASALAPLVQLQNVLAYRHRPAVERTLRKRQEHVSEEVKEIAWKAQQRLHQRYRKLLAKGKNKGVVVTAIGRELLGFIWAIGIKAETMQKESLQRAA